MFRGTRMRVEAPTLLLWGEADTYLGPELVPGHERFVRDLRVRTLPGVSHWVQQQAWPRVNAEMLDFLADL
jgi:pimeloyl-ACP methyl ester carboxylesterase